MCYFQWLTGPYFKNVPCILRYIHFYRAGWRSRQSDLLWPGRYRFRTPVGVRFSAHLQNYREAHPASCTMGIRCLSQRGVVLITNPPCNAEVKEMLYLYLCSLHTNILFCLYFCSLYMFKYICRVSNPQILITYYICACSERTNFTGNLHRNDVSVAYTCSNIFVVFLIHKY